MYFGDVMSKNKINSALNDNIDTINRVVIEGVSPEIDDGLVPIKRVVGEKVKVKAYVFSDSHDEISASVLYRKGDQKDWHELPMQGLGNDCWVADFPVEEQGQYYYTVSGWIDQFSTWKKKVKEKYKAAQDIKMDLLIGADIITDAASKARGKDAKKLQNYSKSLKGLPDTENALLIVEDLQLSELMAQFQDKKSFTTYHKELPVWVDRKKALFSTWYELFPRSCGPNPKKHGTFRDCEKLLPVISNMGFDVLYLPPIHPIGNTYRKGKNNQPVAKPDDPGSPWSIGSKEGGHKAINPKLGTMDALMRFLDVAGRYGLEVALDLAFQCSPDHPYVKEHPEWFKTLSDGSIQYAENPPKKYEDVIPFNFETKNWRELWKELMSIVVFWIEKGIRIFRVDNPHTKPFTFWKWLIEEIKSKYPDVIFLSEAFARPKVMNKLAKVGFTQSYTYFTWRHTKWDFLEYMNELINTERREFYRPNFWPNTPDILPEYLQYGGRQAFIIRFILAATLSSNYGIYGPAFELYINEALPGREEYLNSEKYEIKNWNWNQQDNLREIISKVNQIRRENPALQTTWNLEFYDIDNEQMLCYQKATDDRSNIILVVVNLDPFHTQSGTIKMELDKLGITPEQSYLVHDLLGEDKFIWVGEYNSVELDPQVLPARIFRVHTKMHREEDFDYFM